MGMTHDYRHEAGSTWVTHISGFGDLLYDWDGFRLGGRMGLGMGFADLGNAYKADNDNSRSFLGLYIDLAMLLEIALGERFVIGTELGMTVLGWTGADPDNSAQESEEVAMTASLGGLALLYAGMVF